MISKFWDKKIEEAFKLKESGSKKYSDWKMVHLITLKYSMPISIRGIGAMEGAIRIVKDQEMFKLLNKREKEFIGNLAGGG